MYRVDVLTHVRLQIIVICFVIPFCTLFTIKIQIWEEIWYIMCIFYDKMRNFKIGGYSNSDLVGIQIQKRLY